MYHGTQRPCLPVHRAGCYLKSVLSDKPMIFQIIDFAYCSTEVEQAQESYRDLVF